MRTDRRVLSPIVARSEGATSLSVTSTLIAGWLVVQTALWPSHVGPVQDLDGAVLRRAAPLHSPMRLLPGRTARGPWSAETKRSAPAPNRDIPGLEDRPAFRPPSLVRHALSRRELASPPAPRRAEVPVRAALSGSLLSPVSADRTKAKRPVHPHRPELLALFRADLAAERRRRFEWCVRDRCWPWNAPLLISYFQVTFAQRKSAVAEACRTSDPRGLPCGRTLHKSQGGGSDVLLDPLRHGLLLTERGLQGRHSGRMAH
jgi:hypothetical protein